MRQRFLIIGGLVVVLSVAIFFIASDTGQKVFEATFSPRKEVFEISLEPSMQEPDDTARAEAQKIADSLKDVFITEVMAGSASSSDFEFIELWNPNTEPFDLTGYSIRKKTSGGSVSTLVSAKRLEGEIILPQKHFLIAKEGGYSGAPTPDLFYPASYSLSYKNNSVILYKSDGSVAEEISWVEIPPGQSFQRENSASSSFILTKLPSPENSR